MDTKLLNDATAATPAANWRKAAQCYSGQGRRMGEGLNQRGRVSPNIFCMQNEGASGDVDENKKKRQSVRFSDTA